jgi:hypothetical protein
MRQQRKYREEISLLEIAEGRFSSAINFLAMWKCEYAQIGKRNLRRSFELHILQGQVRNGQMSKCRNFDFDSPEL